MHADRERVVQVRAGTSLLHVLQEQQLSQSPSSTSLPLMPPSPTPTLASKRRSHKKIGVEAAGDHRRRRDALPRIAKGVMQHSDSSTSFEQYQNFVANKIYREGTMHLQNRRVAIVPKADLLKKLAAVSAAALKEIESEEDTPAVRESLRKKLLRAMILLQGGRAFQQAKSLSPPPPPVYSEIKNSHLAFLQFKHDGVATDEFWLRVDPAALAPRSLDARRLCFNSDNDRNLDPTNEEGGGDDLSSLLSDTNYYLGCPGWLDDGESTLALPQATMISGQLVDTQKAASTKHLGNPGQKRFRIVAMKAVTPSKDYYGDDAATREYAVETNDGIMRLARWRFIRYTPPKYERVGKTENVGGGTGLNNDEDVNVAMVNCSIVYLVLSDFALVYDEGIKRGVGVHVSSEARVSPVERLKFHCNDHENVKKQRRYHHNSNKSDGSVIADAAHYSGCARWQVRILQRTGGANYLQELESAIAAVTGDVRKGDGVRVEWLRKKQKKMVSNNRRMQAKDGFVLDARRKYDLVAAQSNSKLEEIERQKGAQAAEYFQQRLKSLEATGSAHQPYEVLQLKQQQLQRVFELPHL
ncbi:unnamed protein product [Phytophthora fragariaefolia]|uniref:Unnamed protein product n=1 Tax=Phytophthora fragariaefolia TaxID=1490495 RepID=A0A9W7CN00_9STRA|nr:unnamed protein product [Phytophthora fragariaefolia]